MKASRLGAPAGRLVLIAAAIGCVFGPLMALVVTWQGAVLLGWDAAATFFVTSVWLKIGRLDAAATKTVAVREDPSVVLADLMIIGAGLACLGAVGLVLIKAANSHGELKALLISIGVLSVGLSWAALHSVFTLRYARLFYRSDPPGGIDFNEDGLPDYLDFAYLSFTIGLTFQVSDTNLTSKGFRRLALRHAILSFLFGAVIIGLTINVVASLLH
jgi:uncharacterized membrane protein